ncbi:hypothetical protein FQR65_LT08586 [Abscondita terminalis]|nr:hypothetical protein FQR65_LT08586 [Abscondita terminalis]
MTSKKQFQQHFLILAMLAYTNMASGNLDLKSMSLESAIGCSACTTPRLNEPFVLAKVKVAPICVLLQYPVTVCNGMIDVFGPTVYEAFKHTTKNALEICSMFQEGLCPNVNVPEDEWTVNLPNIPKPPLQNRPLPQAGGSVLKVLHLADIHQDLFYTVGSVDSCDEPLCCRTSSFPKLSEPVQYAGRWGSYNCDMPSIMIEKTLQHIAAQHSNIDYIIFTGDIPPHDIWKQDRSIVLNVIRKTYQQLKQAFPNTRIIPNIGNHELVPDGSFTPPWVQKTQFTTSWLLSELYSIWKDWLPQSANATFFKGGYFSVPIRPGFRHRPRSTIRMLAQQLQDAENVGDKVHIIGHVPPGDSNCLEMWSRNYYKIANRYEDTITAHFHGHTHFDEFKVFYDDVNYARPISVDYVAPSLTSYGDLNPGYKFIHIDAESTEVIDSETWVLNLLQANSQNVLNWALSYSAKSEYNLTNLRPSEWNNLIKRMEVDDNLFQKFYGNYHRHSSVAEAPDQAKKDTILCNLKSAKSHSSQIFCN